MMDFITQCRRIILDHVRNSLDASGQSVRARVFDESDIRVLWQSRCLQNWKAIFDTNLKDGLFYAVTYSGDHKAYYLDVYEHKQTRVLRCAQYKENA